MGEGRHGSVFQITGTYSCSPSGTAARPVLEQQGHGRMTIRPEESCLAGTGTAQEAAVAAAGIIEGIEKLAETLLEADEGEEEGQLPSFLLSELFLVPNNWQNLIGS